MKIVALKYGDSDYGANNLIRGEDPAVKWKISFAFYLVQTGDRNILVDVGCDHGGSFVMERFRTPAEVVQDYGLAPHEITDVVISHAHFDHIGSIQHYPEARVYIHRKAYEGKGKEYIPENFDLHLFEEEFTLCPGVVVRPIGGHAAGSSVVLCDGGEKTYLLCGDECYLLENFRRGVPIGASRRPEISEAFVRDYTRPDIVPLVCHDPSLLPGRLGSEVVFED